VIRRSKEVRQRRGDRESGSVQVRARRVSAEHVFELARHLTERDREVALCLYDQQVLTTEQLTMLFFSSKRRAQDRLLFLYRQRVVDRFYPPSRFGSGKPQAHWLLDEAGAILVAASLDLDRRQLGWQRREDWVPHPQLAHRLELNRFVTDLIAATLPDPALGVSAWYGPRQAAARLGEKMRGTLRPDSELILLTPAGAVDLLLEWDRGTETQERLWEKLRRYRNAEHKVDYDERGPRSVLFVVPGPRRLRTLRDTYTEVNRDGSWPILATTAAELHRAGPLAPIWCRLDDEQPPWALTALPVRHDLDHPDPATALGRRWRHDRPGFWEQLSPLARPLAADASPTVEASEMTATDDAHTHDASAAQQTGIADTRPEELQPPAPAEGLVAMRRRLEDELREDIAAARAADAARRAGRATADLRPSGIDGFMDDHEQDDDLNEEG
jgi:hypothetical protein